MRQQKLWCWFSTLPFFSFFVSLIFFLESSEITGLTYPTFEDRKTEQFNHMAVHHHIERVYIGGVNRIYQLSRDLKLESVAVMGPQDDSPKCPVTRLCPKEPRHPTDYHNKALVIDHSQSKLIACGSLFQGICSVHHLKNVSIYDVPANESVVANNDIASTVAFIAPGPENLLRPHVFYVGVSWTDKGPYRADVPAVSSRSLDPSNMFAIAHESITTGTKITVNSLSREIYPITYVYGFSSKGFSYFVTVQKFYTDYPTPFVSKLVRVCQKDLSYYSYTEVPLVCRSHGTDYNLVQSAYVGRPGSDLAKSLGISAQDSVLFAVFAKSKDEADIYNKPSPNSALCVYSLPSVRRKFTQNIQNCFDGHGERGLDFINPSQPCYPANLKIYEQFCGMDVNTPLGGTIPIEAVPALEFSDILLTAVTATSHGRHTVAFLGTSSGHLKKVIIETAEDATEYSDITIEDGSPVNSDMLFDKYKNNLYVMTKRKVTKVKVQECEQYHTCVDCLSARDPYCGWCMPENLCSTRTECSKAIENPLYWQAYNSGLCVTITGVHPSQVPHTSTRMLVIGVDNQSILEGELLCVFTVFDEILMTNATRITNGLSCPTPSSYLLPPVPFTAHYYTVTLSARTQTGFSSMMTNIDFYDCNTYTTCTDCVSSQFPCDWCILGHKCTYDTNENCPDDLLVTGISNIRDSIRFGPDFCPHINQTFDGSTEILIASGEKRRVMMKVNNLLIGSFQRTMHVTNLKCQFNIEGRIETVNANLVADMIYCDEMLFSYNATTINENTKFAVLWDVNKPLDNPANIQVLIFKCSEMAKNCGTCLHVPSKYACGWCQQKKSCEVFEHCDSSLTLWLDSKQTCLDPQIISFFPKSGPWDGRTNVTIIGTDLGQAFYDIHDGVRFIYQDSFTGVYSNTALCTPYPELYETSTKITCSIAEACVDVPLCKNFISKGMRGVVEIKVSNLYTIRSREEYIFSNPQIFGIVPNKGPMSGGTVLNIHGIHMDTGDHAQAFIGNFPCNITNRTCKKIICVTAATNRITRGKVWVKFDNAVREFKDFDYLYMEDPTVKSLITDHYNGSPRGIPSGGITIEVAGVRLDVVTRSDMYVILNGQKYYGICRMMSIERMKCRSPSVPPEKLAFFGMDDVEPIELEYGFKMDNVTGVQNLNSQHGFPKFHMYPDPIYYPFIEKDRIKNLNSDYLTINGKNLNLAVEADGIAVRIGVGVCNITSLSRSQLTCRPPAEQPPERGADGKPDANQVPQVIVEVGHNLKFIIGRLKYVLPSHHDNY